MAWLPDFGNHARTGTTDDHHHTQHPHTHPHNPAPNHPKPPRLELWVSALERTTAALDRALPEPTRAIAVMGERVDHVDGLATDLAVELTRTAASLERILPEVSNAVGGMDSRVKNLDATISDLGKLVFGLIDVIPGARRVLRRAGPQGE